MNRREFLKRSTAAGVMIAFGERAAMAAMPTLPDSAPAKLPRWRGFNLQEKIRVAKQQPYVERDFEWLAEWGFDFVRLPMDYRCWAPTLAAEFHEPTLREIDQAIEWGNQYGVHVNLNLHHAPGYCVNLPKNEITLWTDPPAQDEFARHWGVFAKRYQSIPSRRLSFNLINEPANVTGPDYAFVIKKAVDAIRAEDPARLIIADGLEWGRQPAPELIPLGIAQSTRGYEPMLISHYEAPWVRQPEPPPRPVWPVPIGINDHLYGAAKPDLQSPLVLRVECPQPVAFSLRVGHVSNQAELIVHADDVVVLQQSLVPGPGRGDWTKAVANPQGGYEADYDCDYAAAIPAGTREIRIAVGQGDWLTFHEIRLNDIVLRPIDHKSGVKQESFTVNAGGARPVKPRYLHSKDTLQKRMVEPWQKLAAKGVGVHVGEWGAFNHTPHAVALAWMRDCLENWQAAGFGWALWHLRGPFGILDSDRKDVNYETYRGHRLDRQMLELLRRY